MYCKHCGNKIDDDSKFCKNCGASLVESNKNSEISRKDTPIHLNVDASIAPSTKWFQNIRLTGTQKNVLLAYAVWFVVHLILLVSGDGRSKFFPHIYKGCDYSEAYYNQIRNNGWAYAPKEHWKIDWNVDYYGFQEFIIYVVLIPLIIYVCYRVYKKYKQSKLTN